MSKIQIIDGVDISECPHYQTIGYLSQKDEGIKDYCNLFAYSCKNVNCHYKKWQRKKQECKELKKDKERLLQTIIKDQSEIVQKNIDETNILLIKENTDLQQQLDQLKTQTRFDQRVIQHNCNREGCRYYNDNTFKVFYECKAQKALQLSANSITTKYCDLLQTLTEIKELLLKTPTDSPMHCVNAKSVILQKISEVVNDYIKL